MGDFASPAAGPNGSICINNSMNPGAGSVVPPGTVGIPKHSTVVERLRQRIEGCRRHHVNCESRYQQAHAEQMEIERRETVSLYQRSLEQRAKKSTGGGGGSSKQPQSKQPDPDSGSSADQRNNTLIAVRTSSPSLSFTRTHTSVNTVSFPPSSLIPLKFPDPTSGCELHHNYLFHRCELSTCWKHVQWAPAVALETHTHASLFTNQGANKRLCLQRKALVEENRLLGLERCRIYRWRVWQLIFDLLRDQCCLTLVEGHS